MNASLFHLKHGEPLAIAEMPAMESACIGLWSKVGARHDPINFSGLAHFAEHMVFKGTPTRDARKLAREVESVGGNVEAFTGEESTCFYIRGPAEHLPRFANILIDMYTRSLFPDDEIAREREVITEEISMYREQPSNLVEDLLCEALWPGHVLARPISGDEKSVRRIGKTQLASHARRHFSRAATVIAAAGRIDTATVRKTLESLLPRGLPPGRPASIDRPRPLRGPIVRVLDEDTDQTQIALAFRTPGRFRVNAHAMRLLNILLGENTSSILWHELRESRGLCYAIDSEPIILTDTGALQIFAGVQPDNLAKSLSLVLKCLKRFTARPPTPSLLKAAQEYAIGSARLGLESTANQLSWIAESTLHYGRIIPLQESIDKLRRVTAEEILALAQQIFRPIHAALAVVGPKPNAPDLKAALNAL